MGPLGLAQSMAVAQSQDRSVVFAKSSLRINKTESHGAGFAGRRESRQNLGIIPSGDMFARTFIFRGIDD
jgi:hypothetical protein